MIARSDTPRLRTHQRIRGEKTTTYYFWDGRGRGVADVPLGKDRDVALQRWRDCENGLVEVVRQADRPRPPKKPQPPLIGSLNRKMPLLQTGKRRTLDPIVWGERPSWQRLMFLNAERRALQLRRPFTLTPGHFFEVLRRAAGVCEVSGLPFEYGVARGPLAPSLDRIDCAKGYEPGNIRIVCHIANVAMNCWGLDALKTLARAVLRNEMRNETGTLLNQ